MSHPSFIEDALPSFGIRFAYVVEKRHTHIVCHNHYHDGSFWDTPGLREVVYHVLGHAMATYGKEVEIDGYPIYVRDTHGGWHLAEYYSEPRPKLTLEAWCRTNYLDTFDELFPGHTFDDAGEP